MKNAIKLTLLFSALIFTGCIHMMNEAADNINSASNEPESVSEYNFATQTVDSLFQLDLPKYMKNIPSLHDEASLEYGNMLKAAYTIVIHEDKHEFVETFKAFGEYNDSLSPVENYLHAQKGMMRETTEGARFQEYGLSQINGRPARQMKAEGIIDGINFFYVIGFIEGDDNIYMVMNWTTKDRRRRLENTFEFINGTFKIL